MIEVLKNEYRELRNEAKRSGRIVYSDSPTITEIGRMQVDVEGTCNLDIYEQSVFDFQRLLQYIRDTSVKPEPSTVHKILGLGEQVRKRFEPQEDDIESYATMFPRNKLQRVSLREFVVPPDGKELNITYWEALLGFLGEENIITIRNYQGWLESEFEKAYGMTFWKDKYFDDFIDLLFNENI